MNAPIRAALVSGCLALLFAAPAWATMPKAGDLPPGSGILIPPGSKNAGPTYHFKVPPTFPGRLPPMVPPWMLQKRGEPTRRPVPRPLLRPNPGPRPNRLAPPRIIPFRPRPLTPVIPLPPPRVRARQVKPWNVRKPLGQLGPTPHRPPMHPSVLRFAPPR